MRTASAATTASAALIGAAIYTGKIDAAMLKAIEQLQHGRATCIPKKNREHHVSGRAGGTPV